MTPWAATPRNIPAPKREVKPGKTWAELAAEEGHKRKLPNNSLFGPYSDESAELRREEVMRVLGKKRLTAREIAEKMDLIPDTVGHYLVTLKGRGRVDFAHIKGQRARVWYATEKAEA